MKIYLARHAETNYNLLKLCNADPSVDVHLTDKGIKQAENLSKTLHEADFEAVFISELPRTRQTAEIVNHSHDKAFTVDARLNDNQTGFEGKPVGDWLIALDAADDQWTANFNGGESMEATVQRVTDFMDELIKLPYQSVLVVTHGFITQAIFGYLENRTRDEALEFQLPQGTYAEYEIN